MVYTRSTFLLCVMVVGATACIASSKPLPPIDNDTEYRGTAIPTLGAQSADAGAMSVPKGEDADSANALVTSVDAGNEKSDASNSDAANRDAQTQPPDATPPSGDGG